MFTRLLSLLFGDSLQGRSPRWREVRDQHVANCPRCVVCGTTDATEVHHVFPYQFYPERELEPNNLRTVCRDHHYLVGHCLNWKAWNPAFDSDARYIREMIERRKYQR